MIPLLVLKVHSQQKIVPPLNLEKYISSGQIIVTSHDLTPNGGLVREIPSFQENLGW